MDDPDPGARSGGEPGLGGLFGEPGAAPRSRDVLARVVDALLEASPEAATALGDHRFDDLLDDLSTEGMAARADVLRDALQALDGVDDVGLAPGDRVDLDVLRGAVVADVWRLDELRAHEHDPRRAPARPGAPAAAGPARRARAGTGGTGTAADRAAVRRAAPARRGPGAAPGARPRARGGGARGGRGRTSCCWVPPSTRSPPPSPSGRRARPGPGRRPRRSGRGPGGAHGVARVPRLADSEADPRLGAQRYAATLWYALDTETAPDVLLTRAESDLQGVEEELADAAAVVGASSRRGVRQVLADHPGRPGRGGGRRRGGPAGAGEPGS